MIFLFVCSCLTKGRGASKKSKMRRNGTFLHFQMLTILLSFGPFLKCPKFGQALHAQPVHDNKPVCSKATTQAHVPLNLKTHTSFPGSAVQHERTAHKSTRSTHQSASRTPRRALLLLASLSSVSPSATRALGDTLQTLPVHRSISSTWLLKCLQGQ